MKVQVRSSETDCHPSLLPRGRHISAGEIALPVSELELLLAELRIGNLDLHLTKRAILLPIGWRIGYQVLRAQFLLNLREGCAQILLIFRKESASAGALRELTERIFINAFESNAVADTD